MDRGPKPPRAPGPTEAEASASSDRSHSRERQLSDFERFPELADPMGADIEVVVVRLVEKPHAHVVVFFRQHDFPDVLFAYQSKPPGADRYEQIWFAEELATGALHRMMGDSDRLADSDGVIWIHLREQILVAGRVT